MDAIIAIPLDGDEIFQHFGKSQTFKKYTIKNDSIVSTETLATAETGHEMLGLFMIQNEIDTVICGNIGPGAQGALAVAGIKIFAGQTGSPDAIILQYLQGHLQPSRSTCSHSCTSCTHHCH